MQSLEKLKPISLLLLRVALGVIFIFHGLPKLTHTQQWVQDFGHMGFPGYFAYIAGIFEVFGGAMLILGLFTRIAGLLLHDRDGDRSLDGAWPAVESNKREELRIPAGSVRKLLRPCYCWCGPDFDRSGTV